MGRSKKKAAATPPLVSKLGGSLAGSDETSPAPKRPPREILSLNAPVRNLLVDLDGTLLGNRSLALSVDFLKQSLQSLAPYGGMRKGLKILFDIQREFSKPSRDEPNDIRIVELFSSRLQVPLDEGRRILRENVLMIFPSLEKHFYPMPGAKEFLDWAKERYTLTLATNPVWPIEVVELRVRWAGVDPAIFSNITHVRQMNACKPDARYYYQILETQGLKAEDCLLIGNDLKMDLPATAVGIRVFIVAPGKKPAPLTYAKSRAQAWRGGFDHLKAALEAAS